MAAGKADWLYAGYQRLGKLLALCIVVGVSVWMNWRAPKPSLFLQFGLIMFLFLFWTPGFGVQYLAWLAPWGAALTGWPVAFCYGASALFLFEVYTYWCRGLPWYLADMLYTGDLQGSLPTFFWKHFAGFRWAASFMPI